MRAATDQLLQIGQTIRTEPSGLTCVVIATARDMEHYEAFRRGSRQVASVAGVFADRNRTADDGSPLAPLRRIETDD
jgi:hypothetical protein